MSALRNVTQGFRSLWSAADEYDEPLDSPGNERAEQDSDPDFDSNSEPYAPDARARDEAQNRRESDARTARGDVPRSENPAPRPERYIAPVGSGPTYGGDMSGRHLRSVAMPSRASREKNIYTLKPKSLEESCVAADYLKTGCAVVLNLEAVEQNLAVRIIDFMSGVCYGLEHQGHAMKLGEKIFLFTPGDFEISSDEIDYAENRELIFKDAVIQPAPPAPAASPASAPTPEPMVTSPSAERRSWER